MSLGHEYECILRRHFLCLRTISSSAAVLWTNLGGAMLRTEFYGVLKYGLSLLDKSSELEGHDLLADHTVCLFLTSRDERKGIGLVQRLSTKRTGADGITHHSLVVNVVVNKYPSREMASDSAAYTRTTYSVDHGTKVIVWFV